MVTTKRKKEMFTMYDIIILGSGPAGLTAALYTARANKKTLVLGGDRLGGQMAGIAQLENYPGWQGSGSELAEFMKSQAESFGAVVEFVSAKSVTGNEVDGFVVSCNNGKEYNARAVIIATGASPRKLEVAGARELMGRGVSYCATCDGGFFKNAEVAVVGGGNTAFEDAVYLSRICKKVRLNANLPLRYVSKYGKLTTECM
jgi:thioredoxin reductase (NADPH)